MVKKSKSYCTLHNKLILIDCALLKEGIVKIA